MKIIARLALVPILWSTMSCAENKYHQTESTSEVGVKALSGELRGLLSQEMQALQNGMVSIIPAYISGNWGEIEKIAGKMKSSYILKKSLTEKQVKELHSVLPHEFIEKDQRFHYLAGMLEHVAKNKKPELINFYFSEMNEACVSCHTDFATHKFPALVSTINQSGHGESQGH
ncbi:MAG: hypothetical protein KAH20_12430 [Methylococcales bacterium]|nr:hypothetical protein [Methylococcales bacterium]